MWHRSSVSNEWGTCCSACDSRTGGECVIRYRVLEARSGNVGGRMCGHMLSFSAPNREGHRFLGTVLTQGGGFFSPKKRASSTRAPICIGYWRWGGGGEGGGPPPGWPREARPKQGAKKKWSIFSRKILRIFNPHRCDSVKSFKWTRAAAGVFSQTPGIVDRATAVIRCDMHEISKFRPAQEGSIKLHKYRVFAPAQDT